MNQRRLAAVAALGVVGLAVGVTVTGDDGDPGPAGSAVVAGDSGGSVDAAAPKPDDDAEPATDGASPEPDGDTEPVTNRLVPPLPDRGEHPPLIGIDGWLQSDVTSLEELRGKVVAVQFWTFGCSNCRATIPYLQDLHARYAGEHFEIVGVHAPEFDRERDASAVAEAAERLGVAWPIALDTDKRSFRSWQTERRFWPRLYLIDHEGHVRYDKIGEGRYDEIDAAVGALVDAARHSGSGEFVERDVDENSDAM